MIRFPAFDPPEYVDWRPDPDVLAEYRATLSRDPERQAITSSLPPDVLLGLYAGMVRTRLHDVMLKRWVRQGVISKAWLGTGEEAVTVGPVHALNRGLDVVAPMIRNAGACCEMGLPVADMLRGYLGTDDAPARGRDGHVGSFRHRVLEPISNIGNIPPVAAGIALAFRLRGERGVALTWIGDGSVKSGPSHETLNFAAVQQLPIIFIVQNNQVALGTRVEQSHLPDDFTELHLAYGCAGSAFDGNNVLDAFAATRLAAERCRAGQGPVILSTETFRMGGHATHDEMEARSVLPAEMFAFWGKRDPIGTYERYLLETGVRVDALESIESSITEEIEAAATQALESRQNRMPKPESARDNVYANP